MNIDDLLLLPDDAQTYSTYDDVILLQLATQRMEPFIATSALGELAARKVEATRDAALAILRTRPWDSHLSAYAVTTLFGADPDQGEKEMARIVDATTDPRILDAMVDNVLCDRARFETEAGRSFVSRLVLRLKHVEPDQFTDIEQRADFLAAYTS